MKIKFTLSLTPTTVKAYETMHDCENGNAIKDVLVQTLREHIGETLRDAKDEEGDDEEATDDE